MKVYWHAVILTSLFGIAACDDLLNVPSEQQQAAPEASVVPAEIPAAIPIMMPIQRELDADGTPLGFSYIIATDVDPTVRQLRLFEDGKELGPGDSQHADIREIGMGLYSHYRSQTSARHAFYFSTSDNSDPNTNGRVYELR